MDPRTTRVWRRLVPRSLGARRERGASLIEILVGVALLGIVMVPLSISMAVGWKTIFGIQEKLSSSADAQLLAATFPADVQSAGATGVNPTDPVNQNTCAARAEDGESPLIMFLWDEDLGVSNQTVARYVAKGAGAESQIIRRFCKGNAPAKDVVVARNFGTEGIQQASLFTVGPNGATTPQCTATSCFIEITGEYNFRLDVDRRTPGSAPGAYVPDPPTNVHALGGNNRATVYWTDPADNGGPISGYYLEQTPGGAVLGPFVTTGLAGAQVNGLTNNQSYTFRVRAVNVLGPGPYSIPSGPVTPGPSTPDAPTIGAATPDPTVNGRATIHWSLPPGYNDGGSALIGYTVYAQQQSSAPDVIEVSEPGATSLVVTGLADNTNYGFQVSARSAYGQGSPSSTSSPAALTLPGPPGTPTATFLGVSGSVDVTFDRPASGDFTSFTNFRAHLIETDTYTTPVPAATACPGVTPTTCTLTVSGIGYSQGYSITVQAQNATGWGPESDAVENVDLNAPVVTIGTPSTSYVNSGAPTIGGTAGTLPGDLSTITVKIYSGATATGLPVQTLTTTASGGTWNVPLSPALASGQYTAVATQMDSTGNTGTSNARTFTIDTVAPTGSITAPAANAWVRGGAVTVSSNSADALSGVTSADFQLSEEGANSFASIDTDTSSPYSVAWDTTYLTDGEYDLRVVTTDNAGNTFTSPIRTVRADNTAPTVGPPNVAGTLGDNGWYTSNVIVTWPAPADAYSGIASTTGCSTTNVTSNTTGVVASCAATDHAGNTASSSVTIKRDNTIPSSATLNNPGTYVKNGVTLTGGGADATSGVDRIMYLYCPGTSCTPNNLEIGTSSVAAGGYPVVWDNGSLANGQYRILARVFDEAGNFRNSTARTVTIDNAAPTGTMTAPLAGANLRGSVTVSATASDTGGSGMQSVAFQRSPSGADTWTTIATDTSNPYSASWNTTSVTDGLYDLRAVSQDLAGNTSASTLVAVRVDNTAPTIIPTITGTEGTNGWYVSDVSLTWAVTDPGGSGIASMPGCGPQMVTVDTTGTTFTCTATDNAGNTASDPETIKRDTSTPAMTAMDMRDNDGDGRIDRVVVTFNQTIAGSTAPSPWTLTNVPSGGTLSSVSTSGSVATLILDEGSGAKDTAVGNFKVMLATSATGIRDAAGNLSSFAATAPTDDAAPVPVAEQLNNKSGGTQGTVQAGDYVTITYSETMSVAFLCTTWSNNANDQSRTVTATMTNSGSTDPITLGSPCANVGSIRPNASYLTTTRTFPSSTVAWDVSSKTLTITLGTPSGSVSSNVGLSTPTYVPTTSLRDPAGNTMTTATFTAAGTSRF